MTFVPYAQLTLQKEADVSARLPIFPLDAEMNGLVEEPGEKWVILAALQGEVGYPVLRVEGESMSCPTPMTS